jgi:hypothetical protein
MTRSCTSPPKPAYPLPVEVAALYRVTDGLSVFFYEIPPLEESPVGLPTVDRNARRDFDDLDAEGLRNRIWGSPPAGKVLALSYQHGSLLFERTGPEYGRLTYFDCFMDFGYRPVAPSIQSMLTLWADIAEAGLINPILTPRHLIDWDQERETESRSFIAQHNGHPAAVSIYHLLPDEIPDGL